MVGIATANSFRGSQIIEASEKDRVVDDDLIVESKPSRTDRKDAAKIERAVSMANESSAAIIRIREAQSKIVEKMSSANDSKKVELATEFNSLNEEANRVFSETSFNGQNLTHGSLFQLQSGMRLYYGVISLPNTRSLSSIDNITASSSSISTTAVALEKLLISAYVIEEGLASRDDKSKRLLSDLSKVVNNEESLKRNRFSGANSAADNADLKATKYEIDINDG